MKYVLAIDHAAYQKWMHLNNEKNGVTCKHVTNTHQLQHINLEGNNQLIELPNWQETKRLEFINAAEELKTMRKL